MSSALHSGKCTEKQNTVQNSTAEKILLVLKSHELKESEQYDAVILAEVLYVRSEQ